MYPGVPPYNSEPEKAKEELIYVSLGKRRFTYLHKIGTDLPFGYVNPVLFSKEK